MRSRGLSHQWSDQKKTLLYDYKVDLRGVVNSTISDGVKIFCPRHTFAKTQVSRYGTSQNIYD